MKPWQFVECEFCGAPPFDLCVDRHGHRMHGQPPHPIRVALASIRVPAAERRHLVQGFIAFLRFIHGGTADLRGAVDQHASIRGTWE